jgi:glucose-6-phosphate isomerase, archaeal
LGKYRSYNMIDMRQNELFTACSGKGGEALKSCSRIFRGSFIGKISMDWATGMLTAGSVKTSRTTLGQIRSLSHDQEATGHLPADLELYRAQFYTPGAEGTEDGLYWGNTILQPGKVGNEYFMTRSFPHIRNRAEYYAGLQGDGALVQMDESSGTHDETMSARSIHYIRVTLRLA